LNNQLKSLTNQSASGSVYDELDTVMNISINTQEESLGTGFQNLAKLKIKRRKGPQVNTNAIHV
jgi:hypothetical protein